MKYTGPRKNNAANLTIEAKHPVANVFECSGHSHCKKGIIYPEFFGFSLQQHQLDILPTAKALGSI